MDIPTIQARRGGRPYGDRRRFLLSVLLGFCLSFGGGLFLATLLTVPATDQPTYAELVHEADHDWAATVPTTVEP
jgi:hypothetical protein